MISQKVKKACHFERQREICCRNFWVRLKISPDGRNDIMATWTYCETIIPELL